MTTDKEKQAARREAIAEVLRSLRGLCDGDDVLTHAIESAADSIHPDAVVEKSDRLKHELPDRWLHCDATLGGQITIDGSDEPSEHIIVDLELGLYYGQGEALIQEIQRQRQLDCEGQHVHLTLAARLNAHWTDDSGHIRCSGPLADVICKIVQKAKEAP